MILSGPAFAEGHRGTADEAMNILVDVVDLYTSEGRDAVLSAIVEEDGPYQDRDLFVMVWDKDGNMLGYGRNSPIVGANRWDFQDENGTFLTREIIQAANAGGGWVPYRIEDPSTGEVRDKTSFAIELDENLVAAIGIYAD